eukprot:TRINITY_DN11564_c0_g1_i2.p1 TRINITY_DN11564_c0_g1~~TRINITY_DN11564_c0_g1_i2.p1  ORF type:complete len:485 (-),score=79.13 TRINITY_DN11564_c0_g1_i2:238-1692(-)
MPQQELLDYSVKRRTEHRMDHPKQSSMLPLETLIADMLKNPPSSGVEYALEDIVARYRVRVSMELVEDVLRHCHGVGLEALTFFRWAKSKMKMNEQYSPYAWNLLVDVLGKSRNFNEMWDCISDMRSERLVRMETFASVFDSYAKAAKAVDALRTFDVIERFGCPKDAVALNCLISALCRHNQTTIAADFINKNNILPNLDTYALILEGWEKEGNAERAWDTFREIIARFGWDPLNICCYNSILSTLVNRDRVTDVLDLLQTMVSKRCFPNFAFFPDTFLRLYERKDLKNALTILEIMRTVILETGRAPDTKTFNVILDTLCSDGQLDYAFRLLDEMVFYGSFPDSKTYNSIFEILISHKKVEDASTIFREMTRNELCPSYDNYVSAMKMYFGADDPEMALVLWKDMITRKITPKADAAQELINGLCDSNRISEARKYCEEAISKRVGIPAETMAKLKQSLLKAGRRAVYEELENKLKSLPCSS